MKLPCPCVAWLEDDDEYREEVRRQIRRELSDVACHVSGNVSGFWQSLCDYSIEVIVLDVMLKRIEGVERLSEGIAIAQWIRYGHMPDLAVASLEISEAHRSLPRDYRHTPLFFVTGRDKSKLEGQLKAAGICEYEIIEKGLNGDESACDKVIAGIKTVLKRTAAKKGDR